eukprot:scaffold196184_cov26-Tisochrysis_lutea.AAC.1
MGESWQDDCVLSWGSKAWLGWENLVPPFGVMRGAIREKCLRETIMHATSALITARTHHCAHSSPRTLRRKKRSTYFRHVSSCQLVKSIIVIVTYRALTSDLGSEGDEERSGTARGAAKRG